MYRELYDKLDWSVKIEEIKTILEYLESRPDLCGNLCPEFAVSLLTDQEADYLAEILGRREPKKEELSRLSLMEIIPALNGKKIDHTKYDLW